MLRGFRSSNSSRESFHHRVTGMKNQERVFSVSLRLRGEDSLEIFHERVRDLCPVVVGDARGRAFHIFHQPIKIIA